MISDAKSKGKRGKRRGEEERVKRQTRLKGKCWLNHPNLGTQQLLSFMQRLTKSSWSWMKEINLRKQYVSAIDHYLTVNRPGHENIPHIWASIPMIVKACTLRNALLRRNMVFLCFIN